MKKGESADMSNGTSKSSDQFREAAAMAREDLREMGTLAKDAAREKAQDIYERSREKGREWGDGLETYVREQPMRSLLIAAGVGLALGFLMRRS
jgi:ElaB/YqjD/DUF883 family membrane-anchored ribosome-binding protein